ncbi:hypothetical protein DFJ74DRAFT_712261 [Hyaloraphidium curvatum]|nr:hypothetical protein DFJ74DRAFT_712261 [Hyaloraphidium curvatum]
MSVRILYFASARDAVDGVREEHVALPSTGDGEVAGMSVRDFVAWTVDRRPGLRKLLETILVALNEEYVELDDAETKVHSGDVFAFIPPVSGG